MKKLVAAAVLLISRLAMADNSDSPISASGVLYFIFDMTSPTQAADVNFARFVPDSKSLAKFPAITTGEYAAAVKYISLEPADKVLEWALGAAEAKRISHGQEASIRVPVTVVVKRFQSEIECDSRV